MGAQAQLPPLGPEDSVELFDCLKQSLSQDALVQKSAEAALEQYERRPNFCACLAEILRNKQADHSVRWLAAVQFKNTISKRWRPKGGSGNLEQSEKDYLRGQLLQLVLEEDSQIAVQMAVVFAKVARIDYPRAWPSLFTDLLQQMQSQNTLVMRRVYLVLHHALKELASKRLSSDQKAFAELTKQLFEHVWSQWCCDTQHMAGSLPQALAAQAPGQPLLLSLERWLILLKALRRLIVFGYQSDARTLQPVGVVSQTVPVLLQALQTLLAARPAKGAPRSQLAVMLDRGLIKLAKVITNVQEAHPWSFYYAGAFDGGLELFLSQLVNGQQPDGGLFDRFLIQCMLFHHAVLTCPSYKGTSGSFELSSAARAQNMSGAINSLGASGSSQGIKPVVDNVKQLSQGVKASMAAFWTPERLHQLCRTLAYHFITLTARELEHWEESPEDFHHQSDSAAYRDNVRPCAELLFATLLQAYRGELAPAVVQMLAAASEGCPPGAPSRLALQNGTAGSSTTIAGIPAAVLHKEAVYAAVGTGAYDLHDFIDFQPWLRSTLVQEIADESPAGRPLRRRAGLLIGQWVGKLKGEDRPMAYRALLSLLADADPVMQLAAVASLQALVDDWEFREDQFLELVGPCFQLLANFLLSAAEFDSQLQIFGLMNLIIDRLGDSVKPFAEGLLRLLPGVWQDAEGQSLLRIQVLLALQRLVNALGPDSPGCYSLILPILQQCTSIHQADELNLLEDGLQLWLIALRNAPSSQAGSALLHLFPNLTAVMQRSTEHVQMACQIMTSCVLLGRATFLQHHADAVVRSLQALIGNVNERGMLLLFSTLEIILQCFPKEGPLLLQPALQRLLLLVLGDKESGLTVSNAVTVYARTLLQTPDWFLQFCEATGPQLAHLASTGEQLLLGFLDRWLDKFDAIGTPAARKLSALALCNVLTLPVPSLLQRLDPIAAHLTAVWFEIEGEDGGDQHPLGLEYYTTLRSEADSDINAATVASEEAEAEINRRQQLHEHDIVNQLQLSSFAKSKVQQAAQIHGQNFSHAMQGVDSTISHQLQRMIAS